jgi:fatty-acyl-CoA synthase
MAAIELHEDAVFDPEDFAAFLAAQPDLGTKWAPRFVRVCKRLPMTATAKVLVRELRQEAWRCADPLWWTPGGRAGASYLPLEAKDRAALEVPAPSQGRH